MLTFNKGSGYIPVALNIISHLHRILLVKHGAYFRSSSPIFPKRGQPSTLELLEHPQLKRAWENVLERRGGFCKFLLSVLLHPHAPLIHHRLAISQALRIPTLALSSRNQANEKNVP